MTTTRLPFAPIERWIAACCRPVERGDGQNADSITTIDIADRLETERSTVLRYRKQGVSIDIADRLATRCGMHPSAFWPNWYELAS